MDILQRDASSRRLWTYVKATGYGVDGTYETARVNERVLLSEVTALPSCHANPCLLQGACGTRYELGHVPAEHAISAGSPDSLLRLVSSLLSDSFLSTLARAKELPGGILLKTTNSVRGAGLGTHMSYCTGEGEAQLLIRELSPQGRSS